MAVRSTIAMKDAFQLRNVADDDGEMFFRHEQDVEANQMVGFVPRSREDFFASWANTVCGPTVGKQTIVVNGHIVGYVGTFERLGRLEVGYRIGREFWGRGIATRALTEFLNKERRRPLFAGVSRTNHASIRVLEKCGFVLHGPDRYTNAAGEEIAGFLFRLEGPDTA
jgi:RimJ/RimL family protein N-acetyltransferase